MLATLARRTADELEHAVEEATSTFSPVEVPVYVVLVGALLFVAVVVAATDAN